ncbi:unannotated protein [freshwater metagenome]|uniref:pantoate--beta-alanine ligase (AMP-forming) n=1 Tax=freshwater metagenome TaxID=449393 RepID=A0A6J7CS50_9ZZZZ|nr:pantoate--beta-alanine ligase [Actinomycetota bacterium]
MTVLHTIAQLRNAVAAARNAGGTIALVPTMGALHDGHGSLIRSARDHADLVVVSVFVNPTQFDDPSDLAAYPRTLDDDARAAAAAGADIVFAPSAAEIYPDGFATTVALRGALTQTLEGAERGVGHFDGVTTVVAKLITICSPDLACFGEKDAQQLAVVRRMVDDLNLPVRIVACPTVRDSDGLAMSSRNRRLSPAQREAALALPRALADAADGVRSGRLSDPAELEQDGLAQLHAAGMQPAYLRAVDPATFEAVTRLDRPVLIVGAARIGDVRLIDNLSAAPAALDSTRPTPVQTAEAVTA